MMATQVIDDVRPRLKDPTGWFAAGATFKRALLTLSDGAFKLFAFICLEADRRTGRFETTHKELARTLGKSKRIIGSYVAELDRNGICRVRPGANQYARTLFEIDDAYWPYARHLWDSTVATKPMTSYVQAVRTALLSLACASGKFTAFDVRTAGQLQAEGVPLSIVEDAILVGACRKYIAWLNGGPAEPIGSLAYFKAIVTELCQQPLPPGYREHLRMHSDRYGTQWKAVKAGDRVCSGGYPDKGLVEIVDPTRS